MMRSQTHKLVYYIGQAEGELYDLEHDQDELYNRWSHPAYEAMRNRLLLRLLDWLAGSTYYNAGYKQNRAREYGLRWPGDGDAADLHGGGRNARPKQVEVF